MKKLVVHKFHELFLIKRIINILDVKETDLIIQDIKSYDNEFKTSYLTVFHSIKEDFQTLFIYFLNEFINDDDNKIYKNRLIKAKYLICFLEPQLENKLINNDFNNNILISQSTADLLVINNTEYNQLVLSYVKSFMLVYINKLLNIKDYEYVEYNKRVNSLIYQVLIKSIYEMLNFKISNIVYDNNRISINILENIKNQKGSYKLIKLRSERIFL